MIKFLAEKSFFISKIIAFICFSQFQAMADTVAPPCSYKEFSNDKNFFFVMLTPKNEKESECVGYSDKKKAEAEKIKSTFSVSGLYSIKNSSKPLWKVSWHSYQIYVANDGKHVIRIGPWASNASDEAFSFIENGEIIKTYAIKDLISSVESLPHSVSHFEWKKELEIDNETNFFSATTLENKKFIFNLENGDVVSKPENDTSKVEEKKTTSFCGGLILLVGLILSFLFGR